MSRRLAASSLMAALGTALVATAFAHGAAPSRAPVDVRSMLPSPQQPDAFPPAAPGASGLTRDQRKEAALKARDERALKPAGDAAELRDERPAPVVAARSPAAAVPKPAPSAPPPPAVETAKAAAQPGAQTRATEAVPAAKAGKKKPAKTRAKTRRPVKAAPG